MNVYELTEEFQRLAELMETINEMEKAGEDIKEFKNDTLNYFNGIKGNLYEKMDSMACVIKNYESNIKAMSEEIKRLQDRKNHMESNISFMKEQMIKPALRAANEKKLVCKRFNVSIAKNPVSVFITDEDKIPPKYLERKSSLVVNKTWIKDDLKAGIKIPGAELFSGESVRIK